VQLLLYQQQQRYVHVVFGAPAEPLRWRPPVPGPGSPDATAMRRTGRLCLPGELSLAAQLRLRT
jgi:hypothetical protein